MKKRAQLLIGSVTTVVVVALMATGGCSKRDSAPAEERSEVGDARIQTPQQATQALPGSATASTSVASNRLSASSSPSPGQWLRYTSKPSSKSRVRIEGTSTMHDWRVESPLVGGALEVGPSFPLTLAVAKPGKCEAKAEVFIPVKSLKSLKEDGKPYSTSMDDVMYGKLLEPQFKRITYHLTELTLKQVAKSADASHVCEAVGELAVAGVTNKITMPVSITMSADRKIKIAGNLPSKMSDFKIVPPALTVLNVGIKTGDDVKLVFEWEVGPQ